MRPAVSKIVELYKTSPIFQDLIETAIGTGIIATGQAVGTDMTAEEIALASGAGFGAAMVGRPIMGRAGQAVGSVIDRRAPEYGEALMEGLNDAVNMMPKPMAEAYRAKVGAYDDIGGAAQYMNILGRQYGDNAAQLLVGLAAPGILGGEDNA